MRRNPFAAAGRPLTHYEVLEVPPDALAAEINRAYKRACSLYGDDSLASYSFFSQEERREILAAIEEAYATLIDAEARAAYDRGLVAQGLLDGKAEGPKNKRPVALYNCRGRGAEGLVLEGEGQSPSQNEQVRRLLAQGGLGQDDLPRLREALGVSLEELAARTNIRVDILRALERGGEIALPAVYVRGFLKAYFKCLGLAEEPAVQAYLNKGRADG